MFFKGYIKICETAAPIRKLDFSNNCENCCKKVITRARPGRSLVIDKMIMLSCLLTVAISTISFSVFRKFQMCLTSVAEVTPAAATSRTTKRFIPKLRPETQRQNIKNVSNSKHFIISYLTAKTTQKTTLTMRNSLLLLALSLVAIRRKTVGVD